MTNLQNLKFEIFFQWIEQSIFERERSERELKKAKEDRNDEIERQIKRKMKISKNKYQDLEEGKEKKVIY